MIAETKYGKAVAFLRSGFFAFGLLLSAVWEGPAAAQDNEEAALSREEIVQLVVLANLEFTLLHEIGHALIDHFELPVFGREEDAADQIATTTMILRNNADVDAYAIDRLLAVSGQWLSEWKEERRVLGSAHAFWDSHSLSIQRFYNINCLLYGANPDELSFLRDSEGLPAERGFLCEDAYKLAYRSNLWLLENYGRAATDIVPFHGLTVEFQPTRDPRHEKVRGWIVSSGLVRDIAARATEFFPWRREVPVRFVNCPGSAEAFYNRNVAEITVCYELLELFLTSVEKDFAAELAVICGNAGLRRLFAARLSCLPE